MLRNTFYLTCALWAAAGLPVESRSHEEEARLLWTTDLRKLGYSDAWHASDSIYEARRQIAFGSSSEVVVLDDGWTSTTPHEVRAFVLEAASGGVTHKKSWTTSGWPFIFATAMGGYVAVTDKGMDSYSGGLDQILATSPEQAKDASPDGRIVAPWSRTLRPGHGLTLFLDATTLQPTGAEVLDTAVDSVSFDHAVTTGVRPDPAFRTVLFEPEDDKLRPYDTMCPQVRPEFISNDLLAVFGCRRVEVISTEGERLFIGESEGEEFGLAAVARQGSRFATYQTHTRGHWRKVRKEVFTVFGVVKRAAISSIVVKTLRGRETAYSGAALSPDGSHVAINSLGIIQLYVLPAER